jgi:heavy metal translocating P-type ATPase
MPIKTPATSSEDVLAAATIENELLVSGMSCGSCASRIERKLSKLDGVEASVNYATATALVTRSPAVALDEVLATVRQLGFDARAVEDVPEESMRERSRRFGPVEWRLLGAVLLLMPMMDLSLAAAYFPGRLFTGWQALLTAVALPMVLWCAWPFHRAAVIAARHRTTTMDTLISIGIIASTAISFYSIFFDDGAGRATQTGWRAVLEPSGAVYFDVTAGIIVFVLLGRVIEGSARSRAGDALRSLTAAGAQEATVVATDGTERRVAADEVRAGDVVVVRPGERVPVDGDVLEGTAAIDTSTMTGESLPVEAAPGSSVMSGTTCLDGRLVILAVRVGRRTNFATLVSMVERAQAEKASIQRVADRVSAVFVPVVLMAAALTFVGWWFFAGDVAAGVNPALSVLVVACPCALGLATPAALLVASGRAAQLGIFIKSHQAVENARAIDTVLLDKTGTITVGQLRVVDHRLVPGVPLEQVLAQVGAVEDASEHAIARALHDEALEKLGAVPDVADFVALPGLGARGSVGGVDVMIGTVRLFVAEGVEVPAELDTWRASQEELARPTVLVAADGRVVAAFSMADSIRPSAHEAVRQLRDLGLHTVLLTGDNATTSKAVALEVGIDEVMAEVLPHEKAQVVAQLQADGMSVAMVGDGINDAPALAGADLGLSVARGTDVAKGAADLLLTTEDLRAVPASIALARQTLTTIRSNLGWAFGYNIAAIPLAAGGLLSPLIAAVTMALSSIFVLYNSLRLDRFGQ